VFDEEAARNRDGAHAMQEDRTGPSSEFFNDPQDDPPARSNRAYNDPQDGPRGRSYRS
jgi:hypothetical protein